MPNPKLIRLSTLTMKAIGRLLVLAVFSGVTMRASLADNAFDRGTPAESKGGLSALSSYAPDKMETVSLANGNLSLHIPLAVVGGERLGLVHDSARLQQQGVVQPARCGGHYRSLWTDPNISSLRSRAWRQHRTDTKPDCAG